jgi:hypothetical protein
MLLVERNFSLTLQVEILEQPRHLHSPSRYAIIEAG